MDEKLYHDVMFSLGTGAADKLDIDITSEFALLPDAPIHAEQSLNNLDHLGHVSTALTPKPHATQEPPSGQAISDEAFFDGSVGDLEVSRNHDAPMPEAMPPSVPPGATMEPAEAAAFSEMQRVRTQLTIAFSYGAGVNSSGRPCRRRPDSKRPSDVLPEAWANFGDAQKLKVEEEFAARRQLLRRQIAQLESEHPDLDFNKIVRTTSSGAVALIVRPPIQDVPWLTDHINIHANHVYDPLSFGAAARQDWPGTHVDGPLAHHAVSSRHAGYSRSQGHDFHEDGEESDDAFEHAAAYSEFFNLQTASASSDAPAGPNSHINKF